ncbi:MAG: vanadium-dependent haloperoxidase [Flavobacteriales bacterium]|nr:vanadium-dependent haloperoxidase [Flavobacteriales bacterium]
MRLDGINPVLATRMYSYPNIAAYEALACLDSEVRTFGGKLNGWKGVQCVSDNGFINESVALISAFYFTSKPLMYREDSLDALYERQKCLLSLSEDQFLKSEDFGRSVANAILEWAGQDGYAETKGMPFYLVSKTPGSWLPTPPEYRSALEPHWASLRTFVVDSCSRYSIPLDVEFDTVPGSSFYERAMDVYEKSKTRSQEDSLLAIYWDDNPDLKTFVGHVPKPRRHINPASHWVSLISQVIRRDSTIDLRQTSLVYAMAGIAFFDANLCSWYDKYHYNLIRPVTFIRKYIDPSWMPLIVTPPFPEYTSAHSSCSFAVATVLSECIGKPYSFTDSTHVDMGWGVRSFNSFEEVASEVAISRYFGGIHYKSSCDAGRLQGESVGKEVIKVLLSDD